MMCSSGFPVIKQGNRKFVSALGFVVWSDYYGSDNGGQICAKLTNDSKDEKTLYLKAGERFMQGLFCLHGLVYTDAAWRVRNCGMESAGE